MNRSLLLLILFTTLSMTMYGQQPIRNCGMQEHMEQLQQDPDYKLNHKKMLREFEGLLEKQTGKRICSNPVIIPVAVHYQKLRGNNYDQACLIALAEDQIRILNEDYGGYNADISNWVNEASAFFPDVSNGEACIQFCLATSSHPNGYGLNEGEPAVTFNQTNGDFDGNWSGYVNIFVRNISYLGYSPYGGQGNGDGVTIDDNAFGSGAGCGRVAPGAPYNLGRTLTHELGHYLLLDHIWGPGSSNVANCSDSDNVGDTPNQANAYGGCPALGVSSCGSADMHMNYMDYVYDACMYMFSAGQATRMETYLSGNLGNLINNGTVVCGGGNPEPTCEDGIQNGQETGVDCGGPDCDPCPVAGCDAPSGLQADKIRGGVEYNFSWNAIAAALSYDFEIRPAGNATWSTYNIPGNAITISGLNRKTSYEWRVRSVCEGEVSPWSASVTRESGEGSVNIFPNPASDVLNVRLAVGTPDQSARLFISDLAGRMVYHTRVSADQYMPISLMDISNGTYILTIQLEDEVVIRKFNVTK